MDPSSSSRPMEKKGSGDRLPSSIQERYPDPGPYVPARLVGPNDAKIMACADVIRTEFQAAIDRVVTKQKERPNANPKELYWEEPFTRYDMVAEQQRLRELDRIALRGQKLEHDFEVEGYGIPVVTVAEEERMIAAIEKRQAKEEERKRKIQADWNGDRNKKNVPGSSHTGQHGPPPQTQPPQPPQPPPHHQAIEGNSGGKPGPCIQCGGACIYSASRADMSCTNEPMLPELFVELLAQFYRMGWMTGSGGAMAAMSCDNRILMSPSSLQKERIKACDVFASPIGSLKLSKPVCMPNGKPTACEGIFKKIMAATGAQCVIHSHSKAANIASKINRAAQWAFSGQEYIKGIYNFVTQKSMNNDDILIVPIIENMPTEEELEPQVEQVLATNVYAQCSAILVRGHGVFVYGPTWQKTKIMAEIYEYLFDLSIDYMKLGWPLVTQEHLAKAIANGFLPPPPAPTTYSHGVPALINLPIAAAPSAPSAPSAPPAER